VRTGRRTENRAGSKSSDPKSTDPKNREPENRELKNREPDIGKSEGEQPSVAEV